MEYSLSLSSVINHIINTMSAIFVNIHFFIFKAQTCNKIIIFGGGGALTVYVFTRMHVQIKCYM